MTKFVNIRKYHGMSNDWLVMAADDAPSAIPAFARKILDRHTGVGADGLIVVAKPNLRQHAARIRFFNADGSEAEMSGNGIRCAGAYLMELKRRNRDLEIETVSGLKTLECSKATAGKWTFRVRMGQPVLTAANIPFKPAVSAEGLVGFPLKIQSDVYPATITSMGNPHCSVFVNDFDSVDWLRLGNTIERCDHFPNRTNVEFVRVISRDEIEVRFWERGVGHTMSSGTGSCGASVSAILNGFTKRKVRVRTEAGTLEVAWPEGGEVILTGPAEKVMEGKYRYSAAG